MWDLQGAGWEIGQKITSTIAKMLFEGGKFAYGAYKDNQLQQQITAQTEAVTNPDLPPELASSVKRGVVFGKWQGQYLVKPEYLDGHTLVVGGSGSGKSSCLVIPTIRNWRSSVFAIDIKGELSALTKDYRHNVKSFSPYYYGYDPFHTLHASDNPAQEAKAIAQAIIHIPPDTREPFWLKSAQNILTGAILHYSAQGKSFLEVIATIQSTPHETLIQEIVQSDVLEARYFVNGLQGLEDVTLAGIMTELSNNIVVFVTDKALISALSRPKNITPEDLEDGCDVYIQIPEHLLNQWPNFLGLMVNQFMRYFEQRSSENAYPTLFLLDEFPRLGKIDAIQNGLATLRSRKVSMCLVAQSLSQLDEIYGANARRTIVDNCAYQAILSATDADTQELFSRLVGKWDKPKKGYGKHLEVLGLVSNRSESIHYERSPIIDPQEFRQLGNDAIVLTPYGYCRVEKVPYYLE